ncbi:MAG: VOC family protein [Acidobacteria bacterium]|nr:VOC family protein [Acidobacteriota bacterium]
MNPVSYFEIPVQDMDRAVRFYEAVLGYRLVREQVDGNEMALFPAVEGGAGASGALAKGEVYVPAMTGPIVYFATADIEKTWGLAGANGGKTLYPKTAVGKNGFVAEFADSEGNRIALHQAAG